MVFNQARDISNSPGGSCDLSMDEGVKASNAHETLLKSPKAPLKDL